MKWEWTIRYKLCNDARWFLYTPTPRSWDEAAEAVRKIGEAHNPVWINVVCVDTEK